MRNRMGFLVAGLAGLLAASALAACNGDDLAKPVAAATLAPTSDTAPPSRAALAATPAAASEPAAAAPAPPVAPRASGASAAPAPSAVILATPSAVDVGSDVTPRTISVVGVGTASGRPDVADVVLGVEVIEADAAKAIATNTQRMNAVMDVLRSMQIAETDIQTASYNMWVEQVYGRDGPTGAIRYHVNNQLRIRLRDTSKTGVLLEKTLAAGANSVSGIEFGVADTVALKKAARDKAMADARARAEQLAAGLGLKVGAVHQVAELTESGGVPAPALKEGMGGGGPGPVPVAGGSTTVTVSVQVVFDIAP